MSNQTITTEDLAKAEIINFLRVYRKVSLETNVYEDYMVLLNGGVIKGESTIGFLELKKKIMGYMNLNSDNSSVALEYIQNYNNNK